MTVATVVDSVRGHRPTQIVSALAVAYAVLYQVPASPLPDKVPWGVIVQGIIFGSSYALLAMGLILIYRTTRIVNFAYGAMGAMPGSITVGLFVGQGWNYWVAITIGVVVGALSGAAIDILVIRRFAKSSRLVLTVATIGLAQVLGAIGLALTVWLGSDILIGNIETPISSSRFIRPYTIRGDHLLMLGVAPVILAGLGVVPAAHRRRPRRAGRGGEPGPGPAPRRAGAPAPDDRVGRRRGARHRHLRHEGALRRAARRARGRDDDPPRPRGRGDRAVPVVPHRARRAASASASPSGRSGGTSRPSRCST